jgi:acyl carrier protein
VENVELTEKVRGIMARVFGTEAEKITVDASPDKIETWDSLGHMNLIVALEEELGIRFNDDQTVNMQNFKLVIEEVKQSLSQV